MLSHLLCLAANVADRMFDWLEQVPCLTELLREIPWRTVAGFFFGG
jgi:hypothetical protein